MSETYADRYATLAKQRYLRGRITLEQFEAEVGASVNSPRLQEEIPMGPQRPAPDPMVTVGGVAKGVGGFLAFCVALVICVVCFALCVGFFLVALLGG